MSFSLGSWNKYLVLLPMFNDDVKLRRPHPLRRKLSPLRPLAGEQLVYRSVPDAQPMLEVACPDAVPRLLVQLDVLLGRITLEAGYAKEVGLPEIGQFFQVGGPMIVRYLVVEDWTE